MPQLTGIPAIPFPPPRAGEIVAAAGYAGPISAGVEFDEKGWPDLAGCQTAAERSVANLRAMGLNPG